MADKSFVVTAACAVVKVGGGYVTAYQGAAVPDGVDQDHLDLLVERGIVAEGEPAAGFVLDPNAQPPFSPPAGKPKAASTKSDS